jgi:hypothetical protein
MLISLLSLTIVVLFGAEARAVTICQNGICTFFKGSIDCRSVVGGLSKKDAPNTLVTCSAQIEQATFQCVSKGGGTGGNSIIFDAQSASVSTAITASSCTLDKQTGKWFCSETISDTAIQDALDPFLPDPSVVCPNSKWTVTVTGVTEMCPTLSVFSCVNTVTSQGCSPGSTNCDCSNLQDTAIFRCSIAPDSPSGTKYDCNEIQNLTQCIF